MLLQPRRNNNRRMVRIIGLCLLLTPVVRTAHAQQPATGNPLAGSVQLTPGQELYNRHCAACHGTQGDGKGVAATFLFPKPRNFGAAKYKLISTTNNVPTRQDLEAVLVRGMPGSSMPSWAHLSGEQRGLLIDEVIRLTSQGVRDRFVLNLKQQEQLTDEEIKNPETQAEIAEYVQQQVTPNEPTSVPEFRPAEAATIARGKEIYIKQSCHSCHGVEGKGDGVQKMLDEDGTPTRPRDLTRGIYKGGHDLASLFRRIHNGMPGTPMPASKNLSPEQVVEMVHFLRSVSTEEQRESVVLKRRLLTVPSISKVPAEIATAAWERVPATSIQTFPLWWRDDSDPGLRVQAAHDGKTLAIRLSWQDGSRNASAVLPDEFEDMVAVQLYRGAGEPFLGMGYAADMPVDLWQWRGGSAATGAEDSLLDDYPFDTPTYRELAKGKPLPDFITARVAGNPLATRASSASNLAVKGFGSTTFRPKPSQIVAAKADWSDGNWTVVLSRPLAATTDAGLPLASGDSCSVSFAIWDGASRDRGGQKLVSIWNDLKLE